MFNSSSNSSTNSSSELPSNSSYPFYLYCFVARPTSFIYVGFVTTYTCLTLPLCLLILHHGVGRWRQRRRSPGSAPPTSHTDCFTYNMVAMELVGVCGCVTSAYGSLAADYLVLVLGVLPASFILQGEACFHILTCVERYLAVVHPVAYLRLRSERAVLCRNLLIAGVWVVCFSALALLLHEGWFSTLDVCLLVLAVLITAFCSVSVLWALVRPGPGEPVRDRERVDQAKRRAFSTIVAIFSVLVLRFAVGLSRAVTFVSNHKGNCVLLNCSFWFYLPSSLVLPVLYLIRNGESICGGNAS